MATGVATQAWRVMARGAWLAALLGCAVAMAAAPPARPPWRVVLLSGADPTQPAVLLLDRSFRRALEAAAPNGVEFYADHADSLRFQGADLSAELLALLKKKYEHQQIDLVVGLTEYALDFIDRHHQQLWPGASLLVYGLHEAPLREGELPGGIAALEWRLEIDSTIALAEALQPQARRLVLVSGAAPFDLKIAALAAEVATRRAPGRWSVEIWSGLPMDELRRRLAALDPDTAVLYTTMYRDGMGAAYFPFNALGAMSEVSRAPIYGLYPTYLAAGLTGGVMVDFEAAAEQAAAMATDLLSGRPVAAGVQSPSRCAADARRLRAFGLDAARLPAGCALVNEEPSLWREHRAALLATGAVLVLQAGTIAGLLWQRRRRREAEGDAVERRRELAGATRLAAMGELSASIAHEIRQPLGAILSNAEAAEMLIESGQIDLAQLREILADIRRDDLRAHEVIRRLRALLQQQQVEHAPLRLHEALGEALALIAPEAARRGVRVERAFAAADDRMLGDRIQMQQVLVNLVRNAMDATEGLPPERRVVGVSTADVTDGIELRVTDRGHGIAAEHRQRLFEAFFTTKSRGMGMGLSIVRSIVEAHCGGVAAAAVAPQGTVFTVRLPRRAEPGAADAPAPIQPVGVAR